MSTDAAHQVMRVARPGRGEDGDNNNNSSDQQSRPVFSIDTPEELVQFYRTEAARLREDGNAPPAQLVAALLQLGIALAEHPELGDAEEPLREARACMDADDAASYQIESLVFVRALASVLQGRAEFEAADELYANALEQTRYAKGREHPWTLELQNNLACLRTDAGVWHAAREQPDEAKRCFDGAEMLFRKSWKVKALVFGQSHRTALKTRCNISMVSFLRGDASGLETDLVAALQVLKGSYGSEHPDVRQVANLLASIYRRVGNHGRAVELSIEFGVDPPEDYKIRPFIDAFIPGLPTSRRFTSEVENAGDDEEELAVELLRTALDIVYPKWSRYAVQALGWTRDTIKNWTGMDVHTFMEALGFTSLAQWSIVTRREVLLEQAAAVGHYSAVKLLLKKMGGVASNNSEDDEAALARAFHRAVQSGSKSVVKLFLDHGVKAIAMDDAGRPALHKAAELGLEEVLVELVQSVDDVDRRDGNGDTVLDLALRENHESIIRFLMRKKGAMLVSLKSNSKDVDTKQRGNDAEIGVFDSSLYTGLNATVVNFYVDPVQKVEEHRVWTEPVEAVVSDSNLLRNIIDDDGRTDEKPDFTWIHIPANNMFWVETLMKNLAEVGGDRERYANLMSKEVWYNQLHESLHCSVHGRFMKPYCGGMNGTSHSSDMVLYMPYIHWESEPMKKEMDDVIDDIERSRKYNIKNVKEFFKRHRPHWIEKRTLSDDPDDDEDEIDAETDPDSQLLKTYLYLPGAAPLHVRRTLDQFQYYMNDDTAARDSDQVISRYFHRRYKSLTVPIMMVDQLWVWIIGQGTIVTCFPKLWGEEGAVEGGTAHILDTGNILDSVLERLNLKFREPILSVYELADVIMARCLGLHSDNTQWENERHRYLEIFEHSINYVADEEIRRFNYFADGGRTGAKAKRKKNQETWEDTKKTEEVTKLKLRMGLKGLKGFIDDDDAKKLADGAINPSGRWGVEEKDIAEIFDISNEIELLKEIKDIQDELNILRTLFDQQSSVLRSYHRASGGRIRSSEMAGAVKRLSNIVEKMDVDAQRPYKALEDLLDLKQKQANVAEARITRQSGTTITVFTVVTIIFLPASFMAAFFALPIAEYPFVDELFHVNYAIKWTVSVTAAVAIPLIVLALYVNPILAFLRLLGRALRKVAKITAEIIKMIFNVVKTIFKGAFRIIPLIWWIPFPLAVLFCVKLGRVPEWTRNYRAAKKETVAKGEEWSKRRYFLGGFLQRRLERRKVMDEEKQNRERRRSGSRSRSSMTSRSASLVESSSNPPTQGTGPA